ncbi:hypothetical protein [Kaistella palustris]|uniref:hypothetical protein n=1 Tax=Kaistella palustris TaxID=493376 RepID=UPI0004873381|nr:hypothetical protein [Kaistella palustris]
MKTFYTLAFTLFTMVTLSAQANFFNEAFRFNKFIDRVSSPQGEQLRYGDIEGSAYLYKGFETANIEGASSAIRTRYNTYTDTVELLNDDDIFELPKSQKYARISFPKTRTVLVYLNSSDIPAGYYFELATGKYSLYKKMKTEYRAGAKAVNSFTPAIMPRFENLNPIYYIKTDSQFVKVPKNVKELATAFPEKSAAINDFVKKNKVKMTQEQDLLKLINFMNSSN